MSWSSQNYQKPKNYSRKEFICSCECFIVDENNSTIDKAMIKYKVSPNKKNVNFSRSESKKYWFTPSSWGEFDKVTEYPKIISKLENNEFEITTGTFLRDGINMPFVFSVMVYDKNKYLTLKTQETRKSK